MREIIVIIILLAIASITGAETHYRSKSAIAEFKRNNPCPSIRQYKGKCPGYQIDHIIPLKCKGDDKPNNMQWLSIQDHKAKTKREAKLCRTNREQKN